MKKDVWFTKADLLLGQVSGRRIWIPVGWLASLLTTGCLIDFCLFSYRVKLLFFMPLSFASSISFFHLLPEFMHTQSRISAERSRQETAPRQTVIGERVERTWCAAKSGLDSLSHSSTRAACNALQETTYRWTESWIRFKPAAEQRKSNGSCVKERKLNYMDGRCLLRFSFCK